MMEIKITTADTPVAPSYELRACQPALMRDADGELVVVIAATDQALVFQPDGSIMYANKDYFSFANGYSFVREFTGTDSLTIKGA